MLKKIRSDKQKANDILLGKRIQQYHANIKYERLMKRIALNQALVEMGFIFNDF